MSPPEAILALMGIDPPSSGATELVELPPGDSRLQEALAVMRALRDSRSVADLERLFAEGHARSGYRILALFDADDCRAVAGFRVLTSFAHGRHLYIDDLVTADPWRSHRYGERIDEHLRGVARAEGCEQVRLDSGVQRRRAHSFYFRRGYVIESFNFGRRLEGAD
jgi:GNAT superfamily N-acetyltransferase